MCFRGYCFGTYCAIVICGLTANGHAESLFTLSATYDDTESSSVSVSIDHEISTRHRLLAYLDHQDNSFRDLDLSSQTAGAEYLLTVDNASFGVGYEKWGNNDDFSVETISVVAEGIVSQWQLTARPQWRTIKIETGRAEPILQKLENGVGSTGLSLSLRYLGFDSSDMTVYYTDYRYDGPVSRLDPQAHPILWFIFSPSSLSLSQNLEDHHYGIDLWVYGIRHAAGGNFHRSLSAIDNKNADTYTVLWRYALAEAWHLGTDCGLQAAADADTVFARVTVTYRW